MMAQTTRRGEKSSKQVREEAEMRAERLARQGTAYSIMEHSTEYGRDSLLRLHESEMLDESGAPAMKPGFITYLGRARYRAGKGKPVAQPRADLTVAEVATLLGREPEWVRGEIKAKRVQAWPAREDAHKHIELPVFRAWLEALGISEERRADILARADTILHRT